MSYFSELERENRQYADEVRDLRAKLEHYGADSADVFEHKGQTYFNLNQVEIPVDTMVKVVCGLNNGASREIVRAVEAAMTDEQRELLESKTTLDFKDQDAVQAEAEEVRVLQPIGATVLHQIEELIEKNEEVLRQ